MTMSVVDVFAVATAGITGVTLAMTTPTLQGHAGHRGEGNDESPQIVRGLTFIKERMWPDRDEEASILKWPTHPQTGQLCFACIELELQGLIDRTDHSCQVGWSVPEEVGSISPKIEHAAGAD